MTPFIDTIFGPLDGVQKLFRRLIKFVICLLVTFVLHDQLTGYLTRINSDDLNKLATQQSVANIILAPFKAKLEFCVETRMTTGGIKGLLPCKDGDTSLNVLGFRVQPNGQADREFAPILSKRFYLPPGVANPAVEHSVHSVMRSIEGQALVPQDKTKPPAKAELCAGTARKLNDDLCKTSHKVEVLLTRVLQKNIIGGYRMATLFVGSIQFLTMAIFLLAVLEAVGRYLRWVAPKPTLVSPQSVRAGKVGESEIHNGDNELKAYREARMRAIEDRLIYRALAAEARVSVNGPDPVEDPRDAQSPANTKRVQPPEMSKMSSAARIGLADYLSFMRQESETTLESLHTTNDVMLKLAFAGTILGISGALFAARKLDVADPVEKVLVKAEMFGGIGTAFGTTLLGVILSIVLSVILQAVASSWSSRMERSYEYAVALADSVATLEMPKRNSILVGFRQPAPMPSVKHRVNQLERALLAIGSAVIVLLILGGYLLFFRRDLLATLPSLLW